MPEDARLVLIPDQCGVRPARRTMAFRTINAQRIPMWRLCG